MLVYQDQLCLLCYVSSSTLITGGRRKVSTDNSRMLKRLVIFFMKFVQFLTLLEMVCILFVFQKVLGVEGSAKS